jgi:hypothetical protein
VQGSTAVILLNFSTKNAATSRSRGRYVPFCTITQIAMKIKFITITLLLTVTTSFSQIVIQMKKEGGVSIVPCKVNGLNLSFIFDTGASDVTISLTEASFMLKNGYLKKEDFIGSEKYLDATGNISEGIIINLREIDIEGLVLYNVKASIVKTLNAPLLLGQSALSKLGTIKLDLDKNQLTIETFSKPKSRVNEATIATKTNFSSYKKAFIFLTQILNGTSLDFNKLEEYYSVNKTRIEEKDSLWLAPFSASITYNATSYYYTFLENKTIVEAIADLKTFSKEKEINWTLFDTASLVIRAFGDNELLYEFNCDGKQYSLLTAFANTTADNNNYIKIYLPIKIDSKEFFDFRTKVYNEFVNEIDNIKNSDNQNNSLSYFYDNLIYRLESSYNNLPLSDKHLFSSIHFEPAYWCNRSAALKSEWWRGYEENLTRIMSIYSKGISLYEKYLYPKMKEEFYIAYLYANRGECKYRLEDYSSAYEDYKKAINIYEKNIKSRSFFKYSITDYYYDFSNICYFLKKYDECKLSIDKGINSYFNGLENYIPTWFKLYTLKGHLNYFIFKNKQQACKDWSKAGELGDKDAYDYIKQYSNK